MFVYFSCFEANEMRVESNRFAYCISHAETSIIFACAQKFLSYFRGNAFFLLVTDRVLSSRAYMYYIEIGD